MNKVFWLVIAAAILAGCLADNDTIHELNGMTVKGLSNYLRIEIKSPLPRQIPPTYAIPRPTLER